MGRTKFQADRRGTNYPLLGCLTFRQDRRLPWCPNQPVEIGSLKDLIADASILVAYIKMHTCNGRFLRQRTYVNIWKVIDINLALEEDLGETCVLLNCLARR